MSGPRTPQSPSYAPPTGAEQELTRLVTELLRRAGDPFKAHELGIEATRASAAYDQIRLTLDHDNPPRGARHRPHGDGREGSDRSTE